MVVDFIFILRKQFNAVLKKTLAVFSMEINAHEYFEQKWFINKNTLELRKI